MHLCTAYVMLAGDQGQVVFRGEHDPVSWPEIGVLQVLHGEDSVYNIEVINEVDTTRQAEKRRLAEIYGETVVENVYPGRSPMMEEEVPGHGSDPRPKREEAVLVVRGKERRLPPVLEE